MAGAEDFYCGPDGDEWRYTLKGIIAGGKEGSVWQGVANLDERPEDVAIKEYHVTPLGQAGIDPDRLGVRLQAQAHRLRAVPSPGLITVHEAFPGPAPHRTKLPDDGARRAYFVMQLALGAPFDAWAPTQPTVNGRLDMLAAVARGLDSLHAADLVHCDVKPSNIIVRSEVAATGTWVTSAVLVDYGLVRFVGGRGAFTAHAGSRGYMAPDLEPTPASDLYSFAATAAFCYLGEHALSSFEWLGKLRAAGLHDHVIKVFEQGLSDQTSVRVGFMAGGSVTAWYTDLRDASQSTIPHKAIVVPAPVPAASPDPTPPTRPVAVPPRPPFRFGRWGAALVAAALVAALLATHPWQSAGHPAAEAAGTTTATTSPPSTAPPATAAPTTVASTTPSTIPSTTTSTVPPTTAATTAPTPTQTWLADLHPVVGIWDMAPQTQAIGGLIYDHSVMYGYCYVPQPASFTVEYNITGSYRQFTGTVGVTDATSPDWSVRFDVKVDGAIVRSVTVKQGVAYHLVIPVPGASTLAFVMTSLSPPDCAAGGSGAAIGAPEITS